MKRQDLLDKERRLSKILKLVSQAGRKLDLVILLIISNH